MDEMKFRMGASKATRLRSAGVGTPEILCAAVARVVIVISVGPPSLGRSLSCGLVGFAIAL